MSRYNTYGTTSSTKPSSSNLKSERNDDRASQSGSEDGNYALFSEAHRLEGDLEDESNTALTSQTLNADGTPKRPMNAFMIFARRRRPQVSAENQAMRTGEISKILSKEWVSMPPSEKQFYLEQAKQLKETFNTRYPDYVYRRRPNNSRKRRRSDGGTMRPVDQGLLGDHADDLAGSVDLESSPTDTDDHLEPAISPSYSRPPYTMSAPIDQTPKYGAHSRGPGHQVSSDPPFRSNGHSDPRLSYGGSSNSERLGSSLSSATSPRLQMNQGALHYYQSHSHTSPSVYGTDSIPPHQVNQHQGWQGRPERVGPSWLSGGGQDRVHSLSSQKQNPYSPTATAAPTSSWSGSTSDGPAATASSPGNYFPTLTMPFYPNQQQSPTFQSNVPSGSTSTSSAPSQTHSSSSFESLGHVQSGPMSRDFTPRGYGSSSSAGNPYPVSTRDLSYPHRTLAPAHPASAYSTSQHSSQPPSSSVGHSNPPHGFWSRE